MRSMFAPICVAGAKRSEPRIPGRPRGTLRFVPATLQASIVLILGALASPAADPPLDGVHRVVFLGDSITFSGQSIEFIEAYLRLKNPALKVEFLNLGLPSETVSGLSEPGHAGGQFPRPALAERLDRVLAKAKPDLIVACYGMNDGIYYPLAEERFARFREGMTHLRQRAMAAGAKIVHLTPPVFDPVPIQANTLPAGLAEYRKPFSGYDDVLTRYSEWLIEKRAEGWDVVDVHGPMKAFLDARRAADPAFRLAGDGVHIDPTGHGMIAREVLRHWGVPAADLAGFDDPARVFAAFPVGTEVLKLVGKKQTILKYAWLTATGHKRPGIAPGLPLDEADRKAGELEVEIRQRLVPNP